MVAVQYFDLAARKKAEGECEFAIEFGDETRPIFSLPPKVSEERPLEGIKIALNPIGIGGPLGKWDSSYLYLRGQTQPLDLGLCTLLTCSHLEGKKRKHQINMQRF